MPRVAAWGVWRNCYLSPYRHAISRPLARRAAFPDGRPRASRIRALGNQQLHIVRFCAGDIIRGGPGSDINYGILPNVQAHVNVALAASTTSGIGTSYGPADLELGVKYRLVEAKSEDWWPQIGIYPFLDLPTGDASRGLGTGSVHAFLPIWIQKDFGKWTTYGGGGYWINPGSGNRDFWYTGWVLLRQVTDSLQLGGELYHQTRSSTSAPGSPGFPIGTTDTTGFNLGGTYDFDKTYHLLFSAGRGLDNATSSSEFSYYVALRVTF